MQNDPKISVLLAGESWISTGMHVKGFDRFATADYQIGIATLKRVLEGSDIALTHLPGHLVPNDFPSTIAALAKFDVIALSDIGANSLLLHPDTFVRGLRTPNRLSLIADWVKGGGGFLMVGGYLASRASMESPDTIARQSSGCSPWKCCRLMTGWRFPKGSHQCWARSKNIRSLPESAGIGLIYSDTTKHGRNQMPRFS